MRILIFHGYLLRGTGSNIYNASLAQALRGLGHQVHLVCQERHPESCEFVDQFGDWDKGDLQLTGDPDGACTVYRPDIAGLLPVYVADRYEGIEAKTFPELTAEELDRYIERNVKAVKQIVDLHRPDLALANHLVMGPTILARALAGTGIPIVTKIHGSDLEYTVRPHIDRFLPFAIEGTDASEAVMVGSSHVAEILWETVRSEELPAKTWLGPPGVDVARFRPMTVNEEVASLDRVANGLSQQTVLTADEDSTFARDTQAIANELRQLDPERPLVIFVGKFLISKGVDLLLAAWPLVLARVPNAQLAFVGFGGFEVALKEVAKGLASGDLDPLVDVARRGRGCEGGEDKRLSYLTAFLDRLSMSGQPEYLDTAERIAESVTFVGRLEHDELAEVLPSADAMVVPSTFPEAFGMVSIEAAACGVLPVAAAHSGLAEVAAALAVSIPEQYHGLLSFPRDNHAVEAIAERLTTWLTLPESEREAVIAGLGVPEEGIVNLVRERFSWQGVASTLIAAAKGDLGLLTAPATRIDYDR